MLHVIILVTCDELYQGNCDIGEPVIHELENKKRYEPMKEKTRG